MFPRAFTRLVEPPDHCARVIARDRDSYLLKLEDATLRARARPAQFAFGSDPASLPAVGDYVRIRVHPEGGATIVELLPRINVFARRAAGGSHALQPIAANVDRLFITVAVNNDFNPRRTERYLSAARAFDVPAAIVLTKLDLIDDPEPFLAEMTDVAPDVPVIGVCSLTGRGLDGFDRYRGPGWTLALAGSSGAGKSTLLNALAGEDVQATGAIRHGDDRGKHTTTRRMLIYLADGTAIVDTPGMREFALGDAALGVEEVFAEIAPLAAACRFSDCGHASEPGCAVRDTIDPLRLASYRKLQREAAFETRRSDRAAAAAEKALWKSRTKANRSRRKS